MGSAPSPSSCAPSCTSLPACCPSLRPHSCQSLPLYGQSLGYSSSTNAALVAGFNLCSAFGRLGFGALCDYIGPINSLLSAVLTTGISLLALWPFSDSLAPLLVFIVLNGASNGGFFSTMPTVISSISASVPVPVVMGMVVTSWAGGYIMVGRSRVMPDGADLVDSAGCSYRRLPLRSLRWAVRRAQRFPSCDVLRRLARSG